MEEIDLREIFDWFWNKKVIILIIVIIAAGIGAIYTYNFTTPMYSSSTTLVLVNSEETTTDEGSESITTSDITLNSSLVSTYSELIKSNRVIRQVISNLGIDVSESSIKNNVTVEAVEDAEIIKITVSNSSPIYAAKIANEIADVFTDVVAEIYNINNVHVVDEAEVATSPSNINHIKDIAIFAFVGIIIAVAYVFIINFSDTTIKTSAEVEKEFGIPVIASIPFVDNDKGEM